MTRAPSRRASPTPRHSELLEGRGVAFLASQVGAQSSRVWNDRLRAAGLDSREVMLFWNVAVAEGRSQRELARAVRLPASRIVGLVDELEGQGYLERRTSSSDRRQRSLYLTARGRRLLDKVMTIAADHELRFSEGLKPAERSTLVRLLGRLAAAQGLGRRTHPDA